MPRFLGGIFGDTVGFSTYVTDTKGVYNMNDQYWMKRQGGWRKFQASGGNIDAAEPGNGYTYHVFTSPGTLTCTGTSDSIEYLCVGGGGAGGWNDVGGGGGAGAFRSGTLSSGTAGNVTITVGEAGTTNPTSPHRGNDGADSVISGPAITTITSDGGGGGGAGNLSQPNKNAVYSGNGSAGGGGWKGGEGASGGTYGNNGGDGNTNGGGSTNAGGGGGAGSAGETKPSPAPHTGFAAGGNGSPLPGYAGPLFPTMPTDWKTATGPTGLYAGGGGGGGDNAPQNARPPGGGGQGGTGGCSGPHNSASNAISNTGSGGGGATGCGESGASNGGDGIVIVRYQD